MVAKIKIRSYGVIIVAVNENRRFKSICLVFRL